MMQHDLICLQHIIYVLLTFCFTSSVNDILLNESSISKTEILCFPIVSKHTY